MGFIGVEWDHPWIYWWFFPAIPPFGDTAWAGSLGLIPSTFEVAVTRATSSHSLTILTISKDGWSTLKYFEVLIIDYWSHISKAIQGPYVQLTAWNSMKQTIHTIHSIHPELANMVATKCSQTFTNGCGCCGVFQKWLGTSPSIPKIPQVQFFFGGKNMKQL